MTKQYLSLAQDFPTVDAQQWSESAGFTPADDSADTKDGLKAMYTSTAVVPTTVGHSPFTRGTATTARPIIRRQSVSCQSELAEAIAADVTAVIVPARIVADLDPNSSVSLFLPTGRATSAEIRTHLKWLADNVEMSGGLGIDPLGGHTKHPCVALGELATLVAEAIDLVPMNRCISVSSSAFHLAGANDSQELGSVLASTAEYLRTLERSGISPRVAAAAIEHELQLDADIFGGISKLRAARKTLARLLGVVGADLGSLHIHATSAQRSYSWRDSEINLLRATSASMAAQLGGADSVTVLSHDPADSDLGRRMARNIPMVLSEESFTRRVADPAGGSWYIEERTQALAESSWRFFQQIEADGGMAKVVSDGSLGAKFSLAAAQLLEEVSSRQRVLVGVNDFASSDEDLDVVARPKPDLAFDAHRLAEGFELLRQAATSSDAASVTIAFLGESDQCSSRMTWIRGVLSAGGLAGTPTGVDVLDGQNPVLIVCGSDDDYQSAGVKLVADLRSFHSAEVIIVGTEEQAVDMGASSSVRPGADLLAFLQNLHSKLDIQPSQSQGSGSTK